MTFSHRLHTTLVSFRTQTRYSARTNQEDTAPPAPSIRFGAESRSYNTYRLSYSKRRQSETITLNQMLDAEKKMADRSRDSTKVPAKNSEDESQFPILLVHNRLPRSLKSSGKKNTSSFRIMTAHTTRRGSLSGHTSRQTAMLQSLSVPSIRAPRKVNISTRRNSKEYQGSTSHARASVTMMPKLSSRRTGRWRFSRG